ncbi:class D beta-lactamase [Mesorhizobium sp. YIM 152430]|uniref:class D beta-lactamase n=1 Tax=Mesorhizobium sp. YIM 152430 TaxID=3031761 RepID=UPI0023D9B918|nr:class D beta-lactamase [Mesorhizobium sp. YIM 152430]MDF1601233.1 class D beta-lactamase [Mesorhizobium sp. YIM 152430]
MMRWPTILAIIASCLIATTGAKAAEICTLIADGKSGAVLMERGDCHTPVTPASTFKVPLAVMGYDAGFLTAPDAPVLDFQEGYPDWIAEWRRPTDPAAWMRHSVVWYSQRITQALGAERLSAYAAAWGYGNADFSGDPGFDNGLERAWIASSLQVSPVEQVRFLHGLVNRTLPVSAAAMDMTVAIVEGHSAGEWSVRGKTGSAFPRLADRSFDRSRAWGWYVGWATKGERSVVFARLNQDEQRTEGPSGIRARGGFLAELPGLMAGL